MISFFGRDCATFQNYASNKSRFYLRCCSLPPSCCASGIGHNNEICVFDFLLAYRKDITPRSRGFVAIFKNVIIVKKPFNIHTILTRYTFLLKILCYRCQLCQPRN